MLLPFAFAVNTAGIAIAPTTGVAFVLIPVETPLPDVVVATDVAPDVELDGVVADAGVVAATDNGVVAAADAGVIVVAPEAGVVALEEAGVVTTAVPLVPPAGVVAPLTGVPDWGADPPAQAAVTARARANKADIPTSFQGR